MLLMVGRRWSRWVGDVGDERRAKTRWWSWRRRTMSSEDLLGVVMGDDDLYVIVVR